MPSKAIRIPDEVYDKVKQFAKDQNVSMSEALDYMAGTMGPDKGYVGETKAMTNMSKSGGFMSDFMQAMLIFSQQFSPEHMIGQVANTTKAVATLQDIFGGGKKNVKEDLLKYVLSIPEVKTLLGQMVLGITGAKQQAPWSPQSISTSPSVGTPEPEITFEDIEQVAEHYKDQSSTPRATEVVGKESLGEPEIYEGDGRGDEHIEPSPFAAQNVSDSLYSPETLSDPKGDGSLEELETLSETNGDEGGINLEKLGRDIKQIMMDGSDDEVKAVMGGILGDGNPMIGMLMQVIKQARTGDVGGALGMLGRQP